MTLQDNIARTICASGPRLRFPPPCHSQSTALLPFLRSVAALPLLRSVAALPLLESAVVVHEHYAHQTAARLRLLHCGRRLARLTADTLHRH